MTAADAWRARVRDRASEADFYCRRAYLLIGDAQTVLWQPMRAADGDDGRAQAMVAEDLLVDAASNIAVAVSLVMAAEHIGLRGAALNLAAPLRSISDIGGVNKPERDLRAALEHLRDARVRAADAWASVQKGRGHLWAAYQLLDHERLPGVDGLLDNKRVAARDDVWEGLQRADDSVMLARAGCGRVGSARYSA